MCMCIFVSLCVFQSLNTFSEGFAQAAIAYKWLIPVDSEGIIRLRESYRGIILQIKVK